jgi:iron-sulfur cluster assembly protein
VAIVLTPSAAQHIRSALDKRGTGIGIRFGIRKSGCSGFAYQVEYADDQRDHEDRYDTDGVAVLVDREHVAALDGTTIDYRREGLNASFKFDNPNVADACGCGESVAFKSQAA